MVQTAETDQNKNLTAIREAFLPILSTELCNRNRTSIATALRKAPTIVIVIPERVMAPSTICSITVYTTKKNENVIANRAKGRSTIRYPLYLARKFRFVNIGSSYQMLKLLDGPGEIRVGAYPKYGLTIAGGDFQAAGGKTPIPGSAEYCFVLDALDGNGHMKHIRIGR